MKKIYLLFLVMIFCLTSISCQKDISPKEDTGKDDPIEDTNLPKKEDTDKEDQPKKKNENLSCDIYLLSTLGDEIKTKKAWIDEKQNEETLTVQVDNSKNYKIDSVKFSCNNENCLVQVEDNWVCLNDLEMNWSGNQTTAEYSLKINVGTQSTTSVQLIEIVYEDETNSKVKETVATANQEKVDVDLKQSFVVTEDSQIDISVFAKDGTAYDPISFFVPVATGRVLSCEKQESCVQSMFDSRLFIELTVSDISAFCDTNPYTKENHPEYEDYLYKDYPTLENYWLNELTSLCPGLLDEDYINTTNSIAVRVMEYNGKVYLCFSLTAVPPTVSTLDYSFTESKKALLDKYFKGFTYTEDLSDEDFGLFDQLYQLSSRLF